MDPADLIPEELDTLDDLLAEDLFDTRDLIEFIRTGDAEEAERAQSFIATLDDYSGDDTSDGATVIADRYFTEYAMDLADDIGAIDPNADWPLSFIDWDRAADALKQDYSEIEFEGRTYWVRS